MQLDQAVTFGFGVLIVAVGIYLYRDATRFAARAREASGVVTEVVKVTRPGEASPAEYPVIRFTSAEGVEVVFRSRQHYYSETGRTLPVSYDPADPAQAQIGTLANVRRWGFIWLGACLLFGGVLCFIGIGQASGLFSWPPVAAKR